MTQHAKRHYGLKQSEGHRLVFAETQLVAFYAKNDLYVNPEVSIDHRNTIHHSTSNSIVQIICHLIICYQYQYNVESA